MKILGIGVDIVENKRLKKSIKNKSFTSRLFTLLEIKNSTMVKDKSKLKKANSLDLNTEYPKQ